jgi:hypothetical protein
MSSLKDIDRLLAKNTVELDAIIVDPDIADVNFDDPESIRGYIEKKWQRAVYASWKTIYDAQDDVLLYGTNGASDESLKILGLKRTFSDQE